MLYDVYFCIITSELDYDERKIRNKSGKLVDTLAFSDEDEIALNYKLIQDTFGTNCCNIYGFFTFFKL